MAERRLFNCVVEGIEYYWPERPLTPRESIFFWLMGLSPLIGPFTDLNRTKYKCYNENDDLSNKIKIGDRVDIGNRVDDEVPWADELHPTNSNLTKNKSCSNYYDIHDVMDKEILFTREIQTNHSNPNVSGSKYLTHNAVNNNRNIRNRLGNKELWLNNFEGPEYLYLYDRQ